MAESIPNSPPERQPAARNNGGGEVVRKSKEWARKIKSKDSKTRKDAQSEAEQGKYQDGLTLTSANEHLVQAAVNVQTPAWLKTTIQECPQAVELIARVTALPPELQNDPNVLYLELAKFNKSMTWSSASVDARREARVVQDKMLERIAEVAKNDPDFGDASREALLYAVDPIRTHLKAMTNISSIQDLQLQDTINKYQAFLDSSNNQSPNNQHEELGQFIRDLKSGMGNQYDLQKAMDYYESAQARQNLLTESIAKQQNERYGKIVTLGELRKTSWFVGDKMSENTRGMKDDVEFRFSDQTWTDQDVNVILNEGIDRWFYRYIDRVFGMGIERKQPSLRQQYIYDDLVNFLNTFYGDKDGAHVMTRFQKLWEDRSKFDYIIHAIGLGPGDMKSRLEAMSMFHSHDIDYLNSFNYAGLANTFMERETFGIMAEKMAEYEKRIKWLEEKVDNDFQSSNNKDVVRARLKKIYPDKSDEKIKDIVDLYEEKKLSRKDYLKILRAEKIIQSDEAIGKLVTPDEKKNLSHSDYLKKLKDGKIILNDLGEFAQRDHRYLLDEIQLASDRVARGVILEDTDVWGYADIEINIAHVQDEISRLQRGREVPPPGEENPVKLSADEMNHYDKYMKEWESKLELLLEKRKIRRDELIPNFVEDDKKDMAKLTTLLAQRKGLSAIETRVYERMREYLKAKTGAEPDEAEIRQAIWAARTQIIATGRMAAIGAMMARMPGSGGYETASGKHVMIAPAFEDLVRAMNVEMFASRFTMGGEMGKVVRSYLRFNLRQSKIEGGKIKSQPSFFDSAEWRELRVGIQDHPEAKRVAKIMEFAEKDLGIKFSELLAPGFMATGGQFDGTSWRLDSGVLDEIKAQYLKIKKDDPNANLDNQALAIRYLIAENAAERKQVLEKMMKRTPTKFFALLADKRESMMQAAGLSTDEKTWYTFENALKYAETDLWRDKNEIFKEVNLATKEDFDRLVKPYLKDVDSADIEKYRKLIEVVQMRLKDPPKEYTDKEGNVHKPPSRSEYETYLDGLAQEKLPLTLSLDDFDWLNTSMKDLGNLAFPRRTRDIGGMDAAKDIILAFITNRDNILSPADVNESIKQLLTLKGAVNSYTTTDVAEKVVYEMSRLLIEFNRDRSLWKLPSFLPGGKTIGLMLAEQDWRVNAPFRGKLGKAWMWTVGKVGKSTIGSAAWLSHNLAIHYGPKNDKGKRTKAFRPVESVLNWMIPGWKGFHDKPFEEWPHSIAEAISWSTRFTGGGGNRWNEQQINEVLHIMNTKGLFTEKREFIHNLRGEFKAGVFASLGAAARRYWWVIIVATLAVAIMQEVEEEKKGRH